MDMDKLFQQRLVPVAVVDNPADAVALAEALLAGGLNVIEVTFRTPNAARCIDAIRRALPSMIVGAGTVLETAQVQSAAGAGAQFGVAPGVNDKIVLTAMDLGLPFIPGVMTASEIEQGLELGCKVLKFFPAEAAGGVKMLKALAGPFAHTGVKFLPSGGIGPANMADYLALQAVAAIGGSWLVEQNLIVEKDWKKVTRLTAQALAIASSVHT
jgi:2-dehydro-3-deoxyphosphogluconate aldolase/(4S)-4-hydroxy-2-oxoglutarate aldolase